MKISPCTTVKVFVGLALIGIIGRLLVVASAGNQLIGHLSGGGDAPAYVRLGQSLYAGQGFSYVGKPSAFRPPLYPLILAGMHFAFGQDYLLAIRIVQLLAGIATACVCALIAGAVWGSEAKVKCFGLVLIFPTLAYFTGEILTETIASFLTAMFFYFLVRSEDGRNTDYLGMGVTSGVAALLRFNMVFLPIVAVWGILCNPKRVNRFKGILFVAVIPAMLVTPWIIRNLLVFRGEVLYSTHTGMDLVEGILEPSGRADTEQQQRIIREAGWVMQGLERDDSRRLLYGSEPALNRMALQAAIRLWREAGAGGIRVILAKMGYFWLSTEQLSDIGNFSYRVKLLRISGVLFYWSSLFVGAIGLRKLFNTDRSLALTLAVYFVIATCLHLLFAMNTRLRVPLVDPLICVLMAFPMVDAATEKELSA